MIITRLAGPAVVSINTSNPGRRTLFEWVKRLPWNKTNTGQSQSQDPGNMDGAACPYKPIKKGEQYEAAKKVVDDLINSKKVAVFSKSYCPYCRRAKEVLLKYPIKKEEFGWLEIENRPDMTDIQFYLKEKTGAPSVPRVFIDKKFIGGCDDTVAKDKDGTLRKLLEEAGALQ